jgi:hypothetical protein
VSEEQDAPLTGRARSLANLKPWKKGSSPNPGGKPKGLARFGDLLAKEFLKTVPANIAGQTVNKTQGEILAQVMMKNAITTKQASHIGILLKFMEAHENPLAALEAVKLKKVAEGSVEIDWDDEKEKAYQELVARAGKVVQSNARAKDTRNGQEKLRQARRGPAHDWWGTKRRAARAARSCS